MFGVPLPLQQQCSQLTNVCRVFQVLEMETKLNINQLAAEGTH